MNIDSILVPERTICSLRASSKKRAFELAAKHINRSVPHLETGDVYRGLIEREKLGSTAVGDGIAIPHCRLEGCDSITGSLFVLQDPVDFLAHDDEPVSIMFVLLVPAFETTEHLATLGMLAERFQIKTYRKDLITAKDNEELYKRALSEPTPNIESLSK
jgi:PTS system nitrogen regulatory IIA component|tara:strand:+ start:371 stop:850 length:480 start_codon:yes stop_codon:yes gene_type:complete